jgi:hypothetical protein
MVGLLARSGTYYTLPEHITNDVTEHIANNGAKYKQDGDHDDSDEHQDQGVLYQSLAFFARQE